LGYHVTDGLLCRVVVVMPCGGCDAVWCINGADLRRRIDDAFKSVGGLNVLVGRCSASRYRRGCCRAGPRPHPKVGRPRGGRSRPSFPRPVMRMMRQSVATVRPCASNAVPSRANSSPSRTPVTSIVRTRSVTPDLPPRAKAHMNRSCVPPRELPASRAGQRVEQRSMRRRSAVLLAPACRRNEQPHGVWRSISEFRLSLDLGDPKFSDGREVCYWCQFTVADLLGDLFEGFLQLIFR
jgi:hypothetical protein